MRRLAAASLLAMCVLIGVGGCQLPASEGALETTADHVTPRPALIVLAEAQGAVREISQSDPTFERAWLVLDRLVANDASTPALLPELPYTMSEASEVPTSADEIEARALANLEAGMRLQYYYEPGAWIDVRGDTTCELRGFDEVALQHGKWYRASDGGTEYHSRFVDVGIQLGEPVTGYVMTIESSEAPTSGGVAGGWVVRNVEPGVEIDLAEDLGVP